MLKTFLKLRFGKELQGMILTLLIATIFSYGIYGNHLFDLTVPIDGDVRAHIFKIEQVYQFILNGKWSWYCTDWYTGFPILLYYPPGFYIIGGILSIFTNSSIVAYKLLIFLIIPFIALSSYYFARRAISLSIGASLILSVLYITSIPFLLNLMYGEGPNLVSWGISLFTLAYYFVHVRKEDNYSYLVTGGLFALTLFFHIFPVIFLGLATIFYHIYRIISLNSIKKSKKELKFFIKSWIIGILLSTYYLLPAFIGRKYASPIYTSTIDAILASPRIAGLALIFLYALSSIIAWGYLEKKEDRINIIFSCFLVAFALGSGISLYLPFGQFLHEFRFSTIIMPYFAIATIVFLLNKREQRTIGALFIFTLLIGSIILFPSVSHTLNRLIIYDDAHLSKEYQEIILKASSDRIVIPPLVGWLTEGSSLVTFANKYPYETINGPFNQGDPKFFKYTVHVEWEERFIHYPVTRTNLMREGGAQFIFTRGDAKLKDTTGLIPVVNNSFGTLWKLNTNVSKAVKVTPIGLDVDEPEVVTEFFNILLPEGYKFVFIDLRSINYKYVPPIVFVDSKDKIQKYVDMGRVVYLLRNVNLSSHLSESNDSFLPMSKDISSLGIVIPHENYTELRVPYLEITNNLMYHGDKWDVIAWMNFDYKHRDLDPNSLYNFTTLYYALRDHLLSHLEYIPVGYNLDKDKLITPKNKGAILLKYSYHPFLYSDSLIVPTTQGFILLPEGGVVEFRRLYLPIGISITLLTSVVLILLALPKRHQKDKKN